MGTRTINLRDVPEDLVRRAKAYAALQGMSLKGFILDAVRQVLDASGVQIAPSGAFYVSMRPEKRTRKRQKR